MAIFLVLPAFGTLALIIYSCVIGGRAWMAANQSQGEAARVLRYLALNMCEPVVGTPLVLITLMLSGGWPNEVHFPLDMLICWPMLALLLPAFGERMQQPMNSQITERITQLGAARLVCNTLCFTLLRLVDRPESWSWLASALVLTLPFVSLGLLWYTTRWVRAVMAQVAPAASPPATQTATSARPAGAAAHQAHAQLAPCAECRALVANDASICPQCGLVFASSIPVELRELPRFSILRPLNEGGMSQIYLARDRAVGDWVALKVASSADARICLEREAWVLRNLRHRGVVSLLGWYPDAALPFVALDYLPGPSLDQLLAAGPLPIDRALRYARAAADTLCHLASRPITIVHCDIKPSNLIVSPHDDSVVLVDFGSAVELREPVTTWATPGIDHYGTPGYAAPELYRGNPTLRSDVYGLAATLYHLTTGDDPSQHPLAFPALRMLSVDLASALGQALAPDPAHRPTPFVFRDILRSMVGRAHPYPQSSTVIAQRS